MSGSGYFTHPRYVEHDLAEHPEHAGRIRAVWQRLDTDGLLTQMVVREAREVSFEQMVAVHTEDYLRVLEQVSNQPHLLRLDADTYIGPTSYAIARLSAGAVVDAVDAVLTGAVRNALAASRPPGHHAVSERGMGFCLLANVAIAARHAQRAHGIERVFIVDYDVHHGNGTEAIFYADPSVYFVSTHQSPLYPGTGMVTDTGTGRGEGFTLNIPLPAGVGDAGYADVFTQLIWPAARRFKPELILVSAGFDAHWLDPLAGMRLSSSGYAHITRELIGMADALCDGRIVFAMEGGYNLNALSHGMANIARCLLGREPIDSLGLAPSTREPDITQRIAELRALHGL